MAGKSVVIAPVGGTSVLAWADPPASIRGASASGKYDVLIAALKAKPATKDSEGVFQGGWARIYEDKTRFAFPVALRSDEFERRTCQLRDSKGEAIHQAYIRFVGAVEAPVVTE